MSKSIIINLEIADSVIAYLYRGAIKLFICYKEGKNNYIQNPAIYIYPKALV